MDYSCCKNCLKADLSTACCTSEPAVQTCPAHPPPGWTFIQKMKISLNSISTTFNQCPGSMSFWSGSGSGSADPCLWLMNSDPDPAFFVIDLQDAKGNNFCLNIFPAYYCLKVHLHILKSQKESQNSRNQGFSYYFCMVTEGSGSGRPKNMWIRIRIRIRIRNTAVNNLENV